MLNDVAVALRLGAEGEELLHRRGRLQAAGAEVALDQVAREAVDAGRHGRVRGEDRARAHRLAGRRRGRGRAPRTSRRMRSTPRKPAWPSFMWNTSGSMPSAAQRAHAADAEQDLLAQAVLGVAAVEPVGDARARPGRCPPGWSRAGAA